MTLKVALVIEEDSKSAVKAADNTTASLKELQKTAGGAAEQTDKIEESTSFLSDSAQAVAPEIRKVAAGLMPIAQGGQATSSTFNIKLVGERFSCEDVEELFRKINEGLADGHRIAVSL